MSYCKLYGYTYRYEKIGQALKLKPLTRQEREEAEKFEPLPSCYSILNINEEEIYRGKSIRIEANLSMFNELIIDRDKIYGKHRGSGRVWEGRILDKSLSSKCIFNIPTNVNLKHSVIHELDKVCVLEQVEKYTRATGLIVVGRRET